LADLFVYSRVENERLFPNEMTPCVARFHCCDNTACCLMNYLLKLGDVFGEIVDHEFRVLQHNVGDQSVLGRLYFQLLLRLT